MNPHLERLMARVVKTAGGYTSDCWDPGYVPDRDGYCSIRTRPDPVPRKVHRFTYEQLIGPIPDGLVMDHLCRNRWCCNPWHVEPVTQAENLRRSKRWPSVPSTHCPAGHEFTPENTHLSKSGRKCRACDRKRALDRYYRLKEANDG